MSWVSILKIAPRYRGNPKYKRSVAGANAKRIRTVVRPIVNDFVDDEIIPRTNKIYITELKQIIKEKIITNKQIRTQIKNDPSLSDLTPQQIGKLLTSQTSNIVTMASYRLINLGFKRVDYHDGKFASFYYKENNSLEKGVGRRVRTAATAARARKIRKLVRPLIIEATENLMKERDVITDEEIKKIVLEITSADSFRSHEDIREMGGRGYLIKRDQHSYVQMATYHLRQNGFKRMHKSRSYVRED